MSQLFNIIIPAGIGLAIWAMLRLTVAAIDRIAKRFNPTPQSPPIQRQIFYVFVQATLLAFTIIAWNVDGDSGQDLINTLLTAGTLTIGAILGGRHRNALGKMSIPVLLLAVLLNITSTSNWLAAIAGAGLMFVLTAVFTTLITILRKGLYHQIENAVDQVTPGEILYATAIGALMGVAGSLLAFLLTIFAGGIIGFFRIFRKISTGDQQYTSGVPFGVVLSLATIGAIAISLG